jgi:hypothetical protein
MAQNTVQSIGAFTLSYMHPVATAGAAVTLSGFKMEGDILNMKQLLMNAKVVPLTGGDTITLTNNVRAGQITINAVPTSGNALRGDIVALCDLLQSIPDASGGMMVASWTQNGATRTRTLIAVCHESHPPLILQGNDIPTYACTFTYGDYN